jgi:molybdate transport system substrate-binding protein
MPARIPYGALPVLLLLFTLGCGRESSSITVCAAASLTEAIEDAARVFADSTGIKVNTRFGATGLLARAIEEGAPGDVFISADAMWVNELGKRGLLEPATARIVAWNRLIFVVPSLDSAQTPTLPAALVNLSRIAIGDPETVPAGRYGKQALTQLGLWPFLEKKFVQAPDVRAVLALVERGEVDGGIVYATDAKTSTKVRLAFMFPEASHDPVAYPGAVLRSSRQAKAALQYLEFLSGARGRAIFEAHGFQES